ncbi:MAG: peptidylprolyl isomerase [Planctomycetaceae bacterium]|jgi:parvulin-like peptidyl-prolyl isomerase|nr:peptidylprolyl isomerase [Planctomycetaceae bacterium]
MKKRPFYLGQIGLFLAVSCVGSLTAQTSVQKAPVQNGGKSAVLPPAVTFAGLPDVAAEVNGSKITKQQLAAEALRIHGREYLTRIINRSLIEQECHRLGIQITQEEVNQEIKSLVLEQFGVPLDEWFKRLKAERGIDPQQYADEIIWPRLALKKIAGQRLTITQQEIDREFESQYGASVQMRQIVAFSRDRAENFLKQVMQNPTPANFETIAKQQSEDTVSASMGGLIAPFFRYTLEDPNIENQLFRMQPGQISQVIEMRKGYFAIFLCERHLPPQNVDRVRLQKQIAFIVQDKKLQELSAEIYTYLTRNARVENAFDQGDLVQIPEIIARVNNQPISSQEIAERCAVRYGSMVLADMIGRKMLEVECAKRNIPITQDDLNQEVASLALKYLFSPDGTPNVKGWIDLKCREMNVTPSVYRNNTIWPVVALKKMAAGSVQITEEDLQKSFEANFGPKAKCMVIILDSQRKAQEVWALARKNPSPQAFGELAEKFSIEPTSRALRGEMDPIQKNGGMPELEREAFNLKPGDLSSIIPMIIGNEQRFVILLCQGFTEPVTDSIAEVREILERDIYEKKLEFEMEKTFQRIYAAATVDNYLDGKIIKPKTGQQPAQIASPQNNPIR